MIFTIMPTFFFFNFLIFFYFSLVFVIILVYNLYPFNWKNKKKFIEGKVCTTPVTCGCKLLPLKRRLKEHCASRCRKKLRDFSTNCITNCSIHSRLSTHLFFFKSGFKNLCFQLPQIVPWTNEMTRVISASTGLNRVSLAQVLPR